MYKTISHQNKNTIDVNAQNISHCIIISAALIFAILNTCINWCKTAQCNTTLAHFKKDSLAMSPSIKNGLAVFMTVAFVIEAIRNFLQVNDSKKNNDPSHQNDSQFNYTIINMGSLDQNNVQINNSENINSLKIPLIDQLPQSFNNLKETTSIELIRKIIFDHNKSLDNKVIITQPVFEQATQLVHTLWKLLNMISDFLTITGVPVHEKTYAEFATIACCWLRICLLIKYRTLQLNTKITKEKHPNLNWPENALMNEAVFTAITKRPSEFNNNMDELPKLNKVLFCCLMLTNLSILLNGVMNTNSQEYKLSQFSINSMIMFVPYMWYLKIEKDLISKIQDIESSNKQKTWCQRYLAEIFSSIGTAQALALIARQTKLAFACVVINATINTHVSILDIAQFKYSH